MRADPDAQQRLLNLQAQDTALDRLAGRRRGLPELGRLHEIDVRLAELRRAAVASETEANDVRRAQTKLEVDIDQVRARAQRDRERLDAGQVGSPRELESLQSELGSLARRQGVLEDDLLEVMESLEQLERGLAGVRAEIDMLTAEAVETGQRRDAAFVEIDAGGAAHREAREAIAPTLPPDVLALYEKLRVANGGVGAAPLIRRRCEGCHLELAGSQLGAVKAADPAEVLRCEECRRILVRTPDSGVG